MDEKYFCRYPRVDSHSGERLEWIEIPHLKHNLEQLLLKYPRGLTLEAVLRDFIQQCCNHSNKLAEEHLIAYLTKIASLQSCKLHRNLETQSYYHSRCSLVDVYQIGFVIACEPAKFFHKFFQESTSNKCKVDAFAHTKMKTKIQDELFKSLSLNNIQRNLNTAKKYWILKNRAGSKGKRLQEALAACGYADLQLERHFLAWQCFDKIYAPATGAKHEEPKPEQLKKMASLYCQLMRKLPKFKDDNLRVDVNLVSKYLEDCITVLYKHNSQSEVSFDALLECDSEASETLLDRTPDKQYNYDSDATNINYIRAASIDLENSWNKLLHKLDKKKYRLLILTSGFELTTKATACLFNCNQSTICRQVNALKKEWLIEQLENLGMKQRAAELRDGEVLDREIYKLVNEVWITHENHFSSLIYQQFERGLQQLEPHLLQLLSLRFAKQQKAVKIAEHFKLDVAEVEEKIASGISNLEGVMLQWAEQKLEKSLATSELLKKKISELVEQWLVVGSYLANLR
ncbi:MAG: hypothetical protein MGF17_08155 [Trichodesmium sp. MAG_R04]|jgi:hypothetical protein|nr:hypothetical protein [Trichodesmium sp. MAG_R04]